MAGHTTFDVRQNHLLLLVACFVVFFLPIVLLYLYFRPQITAWLTDDFGNRSDSSARYQSLLRPGHSTPKYLWIMSDFSLRRPPLLRKLVFLLGILLLGVGAAATFFYFAFSGEKVKRDVAIVDLDYTSYEGNAYPDIVEFLGVRYAAPPVNQDRWKAPRKPVTESGVQSAAEFPKACYGTGAGASDTQSEDCLFANIWAPRNATSTSDLPVWVFIQGGGFRSNANAFLNLSSLVTAADHQAIVVSFNYRVGVFGFLASEEIRKEGSLNAGLLDQRQLLHWIQSHIKSFGGNPKHVVLHGFSAGAASVGMHLTAYGGRDEGLFVGAVSQSYFYGVTARNVSHLEGQYDRVAEYTGCGESQSRLSCLRDLDAKFLQEKAGLGVPYSGRNNAPEFYFVPVVDGDFLPDHPQQIMEQGQALRVPMIMGNVLDEGTSFAPSYLDDDAAVAEALRDQYPGLSAEQAENATALYDEVAIPSYPRQSEAFSKYTTMYADATFNCPTLSLANALSSTAVYAKDTVSANRVWLYNYQVEDSPDVAASFGVPHASDINMYFGPQTATSSYNTYNAPIVTAGQAYMVSFLRHLDPNRAKLDAAPTWEPVDIVDSKPSSLENPYDAKELVISLTSSMSSTSDGLQKQCSFWNAAFSMKESI